MFEALAKAQYMLDEEATEEYLREASVVGAAGAVDGGEAPAVDLVKIARIVQAVITSVVGTVAEGKEFWSKMHSRFCNEHHLPAPRTQHPDPPRQSFRNS